MRKEQPPFMLQRDNGEPAALSMPTAGQYAPRRTRARRSTRGDGCEAGGDAQPNMNAVVALVFSSAIALNQSCLDAVDWLNIRDMHAVYMALRDMHAVYMALMAASSQLVVRSMLAARPQQVSRGRHCC